MAAPPASYAGGQVASGAQLGLLGNTSVMNAPFNITSYTAQTIQDQQATSLASVTNNNPSVRSIWPQGSYTDIFYIRGFPVFTDDTTLGGIYGVLPREYINPFFAERVEVLLGPSALLNGLSPNSSVGGQINIVPKRATDDPITQATLFYNSISNFGTNIDVSRRYGENKEWGVRFNGTARGGETAVDGQSQNFGAAVLGLDYRGQRFRASADVGYQDNKVTSPNQPVYLSGALTSVPAAPDLSKSTFAPWSWWKSENLWGAARAEYDLNNDWTVFAGGGARYNKANVLSNQPTVGDLSGTMSSTPYLFPAEYNSYSVQGGIRGKFDMGPIRHSVSLIGSTYNQGGGNNITFATAAKTTNLYGADWGPAPAFANTSDQTYRVSDTTLSGVAFADTMSVLNERVLLTLGVRQQWVDVTNWDRVSQVITTKNDKEALSPAVGLVVKPLENVSLYANYIEGLQPGSAAPIGSVNVGQVLAPYKTNQVEGGVKIDFGRITATVAAFQIEKPSAFTDPATLIYGAYGNQRNRGVELNTFGEVTPGVRLLGGVSLIDGKLVDTASALTRGKVAPGVPHVQLNMGAEWDTPFVRGLTLTGRTVYTSTQYADLANTQQLPAWVTFDLGARYTFTGWNGKPIVIRADVRNITGKNYWAGTSENYGLVLGTPRTYLLSTTFDF
ncbi:MAG TPA: TonB-dependent siderophore receptor [Afipia sp.]